MRPHHHHHHHHLGVFTGLQHIIYYMLQARENSEVMMVVMWTHASVCLTMKNVLLVNFEFSEMDLTVTECFSARISRKTFCYSQVHSPRMSLKFNSGEHWLSFTELCKPLFEKEPPLVFSDQASLLQSYLRLPVSSVGSSK